MNDSALLREIQTLKTKIKTLEDTNAKKDITILKLEEQIKLLQYLHFDSKSEKLNKEDERTGALFNEAEDSAFKQDDPIQIEQVKKVIEIGPQTRVTKKKTGRKPFDESLPREEKVYDLSDEEKVCDCNHTMQCIGEDVTERVNIFPVKAYVIKEIKKKYVCNNCEGLEREDEKGVITAQGPKHLIPGSMADESFLAWSISEKFEFALPFYRQAIRLKQIGVPIPRATLSNLTVAAGSKCEPIYELLGKHIRSGPLINGDETKVQVLKEPGRKNKSLSWMWVFLGGPPGEACVRFQYEQNRSHQIPYEFLKDYTGLFQSDDYEGYHTAVKKVNNERKNSVCHVLCWAHARRYFYRYYESSKDLEAKEILDLIKDIFDLEKLRTQFSRKGFLKQRKNRAELIFDKLKKKLENLIRETPGGLAFGKAIVYTLDNWNQLVSYVDHFELTPSNNIAERAIRPFVIGRKNWLFAGSPTGTKSFAILYSLVESTKLNGYKPFDYLYYIFRQLPYCQNEHDYFALLPFNVNAEKLRIDR